ncbi:BTAD domain-containing putative transcriptional regulator [Kribbella sp. NPDC020789]
MGGVSYRVLGPLEVRRKGAPVALGSEVRRRVLAALLITPNQPVPMTDLMKAAWEHATPDDAAEQLSSAIDALRDLVDPQRITGADGDLIHLSGDRYMLCAGRADIDLFVFEDAVRSTRAENDLGKAAGDLRAALGLWRGPLLHGLTGPLFAGARDRLEDSRLQAVEALYEVELGRGLHHEILPDLARYVAAHPLREGFRKTFLLALYRTGRKDDAINQYGELRHRLQRVESRQPSYEVRQLIHRIAVDDPTLGRAAEPPPGPFLVYRPAPTVQVQPPGSQPLRLRHSQAVPTLPPGALWPWQVPVRPLWQTILLKAGAASIPVLTLGFGSGIAFGVLAIRHRNPWHLIPAGLYAAMSSYLILTTGEISALSYVNLLSIPFAAAHLAIVAAPHSREVT